MNQTNQLLNKIKDNEIKNEKLDESISFDDEEETNEELNNLTEDNLAEYLKNVECDAHSKELLDRYLKNKEK
ncbi:hypothetical protein [Methanosphaera sp. BMS]|uniref:hypothetical protein n=1 Tax=Methanosphaera sp. BMS TaxID=1789762 RepID=UPI000DC1D948|nr:hypothetical protein [Methanosphaera sp. BMS]AWX31932.1 hypothetical protein AW729_01960 [Methanosphaera sp. BMS]